MGIFIPELLVSFALIEYAPLLTDLYRTGLADDWSEKWSSALNSPTLTSMSCLKTVKGTSVKKEFFSNFLVLFVSLGGAAYCTDLLYNDFHTKISESGHAPAGTLTEKDQTVKRKFSDNLLWEPVEVHDTLYWNDAVQTADHSMASINLGDGNKIMLGESSLVVLEHDNESLSLHLKSGQLIVDSTHATDKSSMIKINGTAMEEKKGEKLSLQMNAQNAVTAVHSKSDGSAQEVMIDKAGHVEQMELPAILTAPAPLSHIYTETAKTPQTFQWQASGDGRQTFELARDRDFKDVVKKQEDAKLAANAELVPGLYYWRVTVTGKDQKQTSSETRSFDIVQTTKPVLVSLEKSPVVFHKEAPVVEFDWQGNAMATKYVWQLADSEDFKNVLSSGETTATSYKFSSLKDGHLYWRVSAVYGDRSIASVPSALEVKQLPEPVPATNLLPDKESKVGYEDFEKFKGLVFHWKPGPNETYRFIFSKSQDLKSEVVGFETTQDGALLKDKYAEGTYYWSVGFKDDDGHWVYPEVHKLDVGPLVPLLNAPALVGAAGQAPLDLADNPHLNWQWKEVDGAASYHFKLVKENGTQQETVLDEVVKSNKKEKDDLPDGQYKWMVSAVDKFGRESVPASTDFKVVHGQPLDAPDFDMSGVQ